MMPMPYVPWDKVERRVYELVEGNPLYEPLITAAVELFGIPREVAEFNVKILLLRDAFYLALGDEPPPPPRRAQD